VFTGPIKDQSGALRIPEGKTLSAPELQRLNWYVEGATVRCRSKRRIEVAAWR